MANFRGVKLKGSDTQITAEIKQTYYLLKFANSICLTALFSPRYNTLRSARHKPQALWTELRSE